jgi:hypothetical protein
LHFSAAILAVTQLGTGNFEGLGLLPQNCINFQSLLTIMLDPTTRHQLQRTDMSLRLQDVAPIPEETQRVAHAAFSKGNLYLQMRDELNTVYDDSMFTALYPARGQPTLPPWRLALVTIMQFAEGLPDRQAADAVRGRIDWKYALGLELTDAGFNLLASGPCMTVESEEAPT